MQKTTLQYDIAKPNPVETGKHYGMKYYVINFDVQPSDVENYKYCWKRIALPVAVWDYDAIVAAIINAEYPSDSMQAINNNFLRTIDGTELSEEKRNEYIDEHFQMNAYRDHAKTVARDLIKYAEENNI